MKIIRELRPRTGDNYGLSLAETETHDPFFRHSEVGKISLPPGASEWGCNRDLADTRAILGSEIPKSAILAPASFEDKTEWGAVTVLRHAVSYLFNGEVGQYESDWTFGGWKTGTLILVRV